MIQAPSMLLQAVLNMDPHLVEDTPLALPTTPHPTQTLTRIRGIPTEHQLAVNMALLLLKHFLQEVTNFSQMKLKCFMNLLEINEAKQQQERVLLSQLMKWEFFKRFLHISSILSNYPDTGAL